MWALRFKNERNDKTIERTATSTLTAILIPTPTLTRTTAATKTISLMTSLIILNCYLCLVVFVGVVRTFVIKELVAF